ncbi:MAG: hypothetical protein QMD05_02015 [Candidatus Brocadiaceae bacterium]|nr:hypothetical protein [Candidatus Brocadiaceae bacterium]
MGWGKKRNLDMPVEAFIRARNRRSALVWASGIGLGIGLALLGIATIWLLSAQALFQVMIP